MVVGVVVVVVDSVVLVVLVVGGGWVFGVNVLPLMMLDLLLALLLLLWFWFMLLLLLMLHAVSGAWLRRSFLLERDVCVISLVVIRFLSIVSLPRKRTRYKSSTRVRNLRTSSGSDLGEDGSMIR